ncbi:MAG: DUF3347 domain-containing protein [Sphingobacterium sp.]|uniref:DUF3347 domain-containing protein n=1 Tax=Sphingobacterium sp. JB170 TaxID=1434842 RepID=UPI00097EE0EC|nr:DUF3347 domain-containing protein [Sphingobacterium sp. JB170]SJN43599.1 Probable Co/Zn/Cd efflux system membrane fusion protein [Sphingobacterium sp. JB170]
MKNIFLILAILLFGYSASAQNTNILLTNYYEVKNALVNSQTQLASEAIINLQKGINSSGDFKQKADLNKAVDKLEKAKDLEKQRAAFNEVSTTLWQILKSTDKVNSLVYYQYCPMKKAYWLSNEKEIKNPYYGSTMLNCGSVVQINNPS